MTVVNRNEASEHYTLMEAACSLTRTLIRNKSCYAHSWLLFRRSRECADVKPALLPMRSKKILKGGLYLVRGCRGGREQIDIVEASTSIGPRALMVLTINLICD